MRVRGDRSPSAAFTLEKQPKRPGFVLARFYENAVAFEETRDGQTIKGWEYDEYHLELADTGGLETDITNSLNSYLEQAKAAERPANWETEQRVADLETALCEIDEALIEMYERGG